jgi:hypothetical protein
MNKFVEFLSDLKFKKLFKEDVPVFLRERFGHNGRHGRALWDACPPFSRGFEGRNAAKGTAMCLVGRMSPFFSTRACAF